MGEDSAGYSSALEAYDPVTNSWTTLATMLTPRYALAAGAVNGKLYAVGGSNDSPQLPTLEAYDPATNSWTTLASMPTARHGPTAFEINGKLYVAGGYEFSSGSSLPLVSVFETSRYCLTRSCAFDREVFGC